MIDRIKAIIRQESDAILKIPINHSYEQAVDLIHKHVHEQHGKVVVSGMGKAGQIGHNISTTLSSTGTPSVFLHPSEAQHGDLGVIQKNDILLLISNSGRTRELLELIQLKSHLYSHIPVVTIVGDAESPLAKNADLALTTGAPQEVCPLGLTPTTSTTAMTVVGDILVVLLMEKIKFSKAEYAKRHHSGYLGEKAKS